PRGWRRSRAACTARWWRPRPSPAPAATTGPISASFRSLVSRRRSVCSACATRCRPMQPTDRQHRTGIVLIVAPAICWGTAPFFTRLLHYHSWTILFWRGLFGGGFIALSLIAAQGRRGIRDLVAMKPAGWLVAALSTFGMVTYIPSLQLTSVANVAIIIA